MEPPPDDASHRPGHEPWTLDRLAALDPHEYDFQEFKGAAYLWDDGQRRLRSDFLDNVSKQVSAFATAAGGRLFLGLDDDGRPDGGVPVGVRPNGTREWLEDALPGTVVPPLRRFNVFEVPVGPGAERAIYVVEIPRSDDAPHQARDHRYYLRIAGKSRPMAHHHVLDVLARSRHPHVVVSRVDPYGEPELLESDPRGPKAMVRLRALLMNRGKTLARHVGCEFVVPRYAVNTESRRRTLEGHGAVRLMQRSGEVVFLFYSPVPVFPTQEVLFGEVWIALHGANLHHYAAGKVVVRWRVFADEAPVREGQVDVSVYMTVQRGLRLVEDARRAPQGPPGT